MILRYREITGLVVNATIVTLMALCGVNVPVSFYPTWLEWISRCLPITNGLEAIRDVINGAPWSPSPRIPARSCSSPPCGWRSRSATFGRFMRAGQRDGSLEYAS